MQSNQDAMEVVRAFLAGEQSRTKREGVAAWDEFVRECNAIIHGTLRGWRIGCEDIEDIEQEVWKILVRRLPELHIDPERGTLRAWIGTVTRRLATRYIRREHAHENEELSDELVATMLDPHPGPDEENQRLWHRQHVLETVAQLAAGPPENGRKIVIMYWFESFTIPEITRLLGVTDDCARSILRRFGVKIRGALRDEESGS
jgi:RNA polymerase sigma factor (sigma-70 family)